MTLTAATEPLPRDHYKRPGVIPPDGGKPVWYTRATKVAETLDDRYHLERWQERMVATGLSLRPDLQALVVAHREQTDENKKKLNQVCADAKDAAAISASANLGTALHALCEQLDRGTPALNVPDALQRDVDAYRRATERLTPLAIERGVVLDDEKVHGTPDRILQLADGSNVIADLKTGQSVDLAQRSIGIQLALYAHAPDFYDHPGRREPKPHVDLERALVIHLPAGSGRVFLHWVDIRQGWDAALTALWVRKYRNAKLLTPADDIAVGVEVPHLGPDLAALITACDSRDELVDLYHAHAADWTPQLTNLAQLRQQQIGAA